MFIYHVDNLQYRDDNLSFYDVHFSLYDGRNGLKLLLHFTQVCEVGDYIVNRYSALYSIKLAQSQRGIQLCIQHCIRNVVPALYSARYSDLY